MEKNNLPKRYLPVMSTENLPSAKKQSSSDGLRDFVNSLFRYKFSFLICFAAITIIGVVLSILYNLRLFYSPAFESKSLLLVKSGWETHAPDLSIENLRNISLNQREVIGSEVRILGSRDLKERVLNAIKPETVYPSLAAHSYRGLSNVEAAEMLLEKDLAIAADKTGNVIQVSLKGNNPEGGSIFVNKLVSLYIERRAEIYKDPRSVIFLERKCDEYSQKLSEAENKLKAFRDKTQIISFDEQRSIYLRQKADLEASVGNTENQIKELEGRIAQIDKLLATIPKTSPAEEVASAVGKDTELRLLNLQLQERELLSKYQDDNPLVASVRDQIQLIKRYIAGQTGTKGAAPKDPVYQDLYRQMLQNQADLSAAKVRNVALANQLQELDKQIRSFEALETQSKELQRDIASNEEKYRTYRQRLEESRIHDELNRQKMTSVSVIEPAIPSYIPVNPPKPLILLLLGSVLAGLLGGCGLICLLKTFNQCINTPSDAEKHLSLPVLIAIPLK